MITVKNFDTLLKLPSAPKEGDLAYIEEPKDNKEKVFCYVEGKWTPVNPDGEVKANLYDINATAIAQLPPHTTDELIKEDIKLINNFITKFEDTYYNLLCKEISGGSFYTTIFRRTWTAEETMGEAVLDCLKSLGTIHAISDEENHMEIWVKEPNEHMICLLFFNYDLGIVEVQ